MTRRLLIYDIWGRSWTQSTRLHNNNYNERKPFTLVSKRSLPFVGIGLCSQMVYPKEFIIYLYTLYEKERGGRGGWWDDMFDTLFTPPPDVMGRRERGGGDLPPWEWPNIWNYLSVSRTSQSHLLPILWLPSCPFFGGYHAEEHQKNFTAKRNRTTPTFRAWSTKASRRNQ